jgi:two-component system sensor histidine kinase DesK
LFGEVLFFAAREAVRNAALHGRVSGQPLRLRVAVDWRNGIHIVVEDNGAGLGPEERARGGRGLALHSTMLAVIGGELAVESQPGEYTRVTIRLPDEK